MSCVENITLHLVNKTLITLYIKLEFQNYTKLRSDGTSSESIVFGWTYFGITASVGALA